MLWQRSGGRGDGPLLVLLHGLGGTADLWQGVIDDAEQRWAGPWLAPDLPGHGRSPSAPRYEPGTYAAAVAESVRALAGGRPVVAMGHSLGGVVALTLSTGWFGVDVLGVVGLGIKVVWSSEDLDRMGELRRQPPRRFPTRDAAAERFVLVNGLRGIVGSASPLCDGGVVAEGPRWRLAHDPCSFPDFVPAMDELVRLGHVAVVLARGEGDAMVSTADLRALGVEPVVLAGAGHNAHVERPDRVLDLALRVAQHRR